MLTSNTQDKKKKSHVNMSLATSVKFKWQLNYYLLKTWGTKFRHFKFKRQKTKL